MENAQRKLYVIENQKNVVRQSDIVDNGVEGKRLDHERLVNQYLVSKRLRNHSSNTLRGTEYNLKRFFDIAGEFCWEVTMDDVNDYHLGLIESSLAASTRRGYLNGVRNFYKFLLEHPEIPQTAFERQSGNVDRVDWKYGVKLTQPVDLWFIPKHVTDDVAVESTIPSKENLRVFFRLLRESANNSLKPLVAHRDYAMFRLMYHTGVRLDECRMLDLRDVSFERGTIHIRYGKGAKGSGKRERWVPASLFGLEEVLTIYLDKVRPHFLNASVETALFLSEHGKRISKATIKGRLLETLRYVQSLDSCVPHFTCHDFRRAFATHLYEQHPTKIEAIRQVLGHSLLSTTQRYLKPSARFMEEQLRDITQGRLRHLIGEDIVDD